MPSKLQTHTHSVVCSCLQAPVSLRSYRSATIHSFVAGYRRVYALNAIDACPFSFLLPPIGTCITPKLQIRDHSFVCSRLQQVYALNAIDTCPFNCLQPPIDHCMTPMLQIRDHSVCLQPAIEVVCSHPSKSVLLQSYRYTHSSVCSLLWERVCLHSYRCTVIFLI